VDHSPDGECLLVLYSLLMYIYSCRYHEQLSIIAYKSIRLLNGLREIFAYLIVRSLEPLLTITLLHNPS
jgi:hypothetical protein